MLFRSRKSQGNPLYNVYKGSDEKWLVLAALQSQRFWKDFCKQIEIPELEKDPRFCDIPERRKNSTELTKILDDIFITKPRDEWIKRMESVDIPCAPVQDYGEVAEDTQMLANGNIIDYEHPVVGQVKLVANPVRLSETPWQMRLPAPELGQHTEEVLIEWGGYSWDDISRLIENEVI